MISPEYQGKLFELRSSIDIPKRWHGTPIESFIQSQNFGYPLPHCTQPQLLLVTCIEFRYSPNLPSNYAYVVRSPGSRLIGMEICAAYALARGVKNIILVAHNDCGMTKLGHFRGPIEDELIEQGWKPAQAHAFVDDAAEKFAIKDELSALETEYHRLKGLFQKVNVAPLFVELAEHKVHIPLWYHELIQDDRN